jgi:hypothetical protein
MEPFELSIEFTYKQYKEMCDEDKEQIYFALYAFFNNQALSMELSQREVFDHVYAKTIRDEAYEFSHILKDFEDYFGNEF